MHEFMQAALNRYSHDDTARTAAVAVTAHRRLASVDKNVNQRTRVTAHLQATSEFR